MEDGDIDIIYGLQSDVDYSAKSFISPDNLILPVDYDYHCLISSTNFPDRIPLFGSDELILSAFPSVISETEVPSIAPEFPIEEDIITVIKAKITSHPRYPRLVRAYIDCLKVGAPPEMACLLDGIWRGNELNDSTHKQNAHSNSTCFGADPELEEFMEAYCNMMVKYESDLSKLFYEASSFLNKIELQLSNLCAGDSTRRSPSNEDGISSDEDLDWGERELQDAEMRLGDKGLKDMLLSKFGSHISSLKVEFSKKKKKPKLPKEGRKVLLEWWNVHNKWPYPTEGDKIELAERTGLDPKQINNWFINQRKRHWKPSEGMQLAGVSP